MPDPILFPEDFEDQLTAAVRQPEPDPAFVARLHGQLRSTPPVSQSTPILRPWWRRPAFVFTTTLVLALLAAFVVTGPRRVLAAVQAWLGGYIPSFGYVEDARSERAILEPVRQERDGGVMTVDAAFTDGVRTIVVIGESHTDLPCPHPVDQMDDPYLTAGAMRFDLEGWQASRLTFPALPAGVDEVTLHMPWMLFCDADQADWAVPLHFQPAPDGMALPVLEAESGAGRPAVSTVSPAGLPVDPGVPPVMSQNVTLEIGQVVELEDGFLISGLLGWQGDAAWYTLPEADEVTILDAAGQTLPVEALLPEEVWTLYSNLPPNTTPWAFRVPGKDLTVPFAVSFPYLMRTANPAEQPSFELELGSEPRLGQTWTPNLDIEFEGHRLKLVEVRQLDEAGKVLAFTFETDEAVEFVAVGDAGDTSGGGGGDLGAFETVPGRVQTTAYFNQVVMTGLHHFTIVSLQERLPGPWQVVR